MKYIFISRHAKSSWQHAGMKDFDRPLNDRGHKDAPEMARKLAALSYTPEVLISSSANRALTTAEYYGEQFDLGITEVQNLYHGIPEDYLKEINQLPGHIQSVMLFGHNPGITEIANLIKANVIDNIPTAGVIIASCPTEHWNAVTWQKCKLLKIIFPKDLSL